MDETTRFPDTLITTYLEMTDPAQFVAAHNPDPQIIMMPMAQPDVAFYKFLYGEVGRIWRWRDRLLISEAELYALIARPAVSIHVLYYAGVPAGYVELYQEADGSTEIAYLGLREGFIGKGLGSHLLSYGIAQAWREGATRIWVHTCNLDAPGALATYEKRGMRIYQVEEQPMPERYTV